MKTGLELEEFLMNLVTWLLTWALLFSLLFISSPYTLSIGHLCILLTWQVVFLRSDSREKAGWKSLCLYDLVSKVTLYHVCHILFPGGKSLRGICSTEGKNIRASLNMFLTAAPPCPFFKIWQHLPERSALCLRQTLWKPLSFKSQENTSEATSFFIDLDLSPLSPEPRDHPEAPLISSSSQQLLLPLDTLLLLFVSAEVLCLSYPQHPPGTESAQGKKSFHLRMVVFPYVESQFL